MRVRHWLVAVACLSFASAVARAAEPTDVRVETAHAAVRLHADAAGVLT